MRRITALLLCAIMLSTSLLSCSSGGQRASDTAAGESQASEISSDTEAAETELSDAVPELDFEGAEFRVASSMNNFYNGQMDRAEMTGDVLNDAIYKEPHPSRASTWLSASIPTRPIRCLQQSGTL